eukprot:CAMPEP_0204318976 /NCGR_PEP_ID=MMETSP0469-20131031/6839_1 /ASSEMBLY_ACC=CAM_ASM_000384 /TAXON_ID=2969 /ORGANISM="Oxyrrhis marina" /LENGTH=51 /DNA_ID=CAMNT_0051300091 /DNA_START=326 /DNA_END=477 /DNA_ORIENTATION=+
MTEKTMPLKHASRQQTADRHCWLRDAPTGGWGPPLALPNSRAPPARYPACS